MFCSCTNTTTGNELGSRRKISLVVAVVVVVVVAVAVAVAAATVAVGVVCDFQAGAFPVPDWREWKPAQAKPGERTLIVSA